MVKRDLSDAQVSLVIDFLKRWGIDSPELVFELTDHYCEKAKDQMHHGLSFEEVLNSWKTKKHFRDLKKIQSDYERTVKKKWWRAHLAALRKLFLTKQIFFFMAVLWALFQSYRMDYGFAFSLVALIGAIFGLVLMSYLYWVKQFSWFFKSRDLTLPFMGVWLINWEYVANGAYTKLFSGEPYELSPVTLTISIFCAFVGFNLVSSAYRELNMITSEYISEPNKYQFR